MVYELIAYNTDSRYPDDIRYRRYTSSKRLANNFAKIPKIQFTDSGHGIVFLAREHHGHEYPERSEIYDYVNTKLHEMRLKQMRVVKQKPFIIVLQTHTGHHLNGLLAVLIRALALGQTGNVYAVAAQYSAQQKIC